MMVRGTTIVLQFEVISSDRIVHDIINMYQHLSMFMGMEAWPSPIWQKHDLKWKDLSQHFAKKIFFVMMNSNDVVFLFNPAHDSNTSKILAKSLNTW